MTHHIQAEQDLAARVIGPWIGRCFGALVVKKACSSLDADTVSSEVRDVLQQTLRILSEGLLTEENAVPLLDQIQRFQEIYPKVTTNWIKCELQQISATLLSFRSAAGEGGGDH
jgi:hypothetical protein